MTIRFVSFQAVLRLMEVEHEIRSQDRSNQEMQEPLAQETAISPAVRLTTLAHTSNAYKASLS